LRPVLCFLHGYGEAAPLAIEQALRRHGPLRLGTPARALQPFLVMAPQLPRRGDVWREQASAVREIVREVQRECGGDPSRTYLTGFSYGGNGVFDLAALQPDLWAALWAVDPTRVPPRRLERPVWLSIGEAARHSAERFVSALALQPAEASGFAGDRLFLDEGADHVGSAALAYRDERIYSWLLSKQLAPTLKEAL
jgi:predicted peptidase